MLCYEVHYTLDVECHYIKLNILLVELQVVTYLKTIPVSRRVDQSVECCFRAVLLNALYQNTDPFQEKKSCCDIYSFEKESLKLNTYK